jgi:hypothetical protein
MPQTDPYAAIATPIPAAQATPAATDDPYASIATPIPPPEESLAKVGSFAKGVGEGAVTSMGESIQSLPWVGKKILSPEAMQAEREYFKPGSAAEKYGQTTGDIAEPVLEFVMGDEALKGLAIADKVGLASKIAKIAQDSPYIGKLLQHGVNAARMGTVGTAEALAKGATPSQAVKTGAATGVGGEALSTAVEAAPAAAKAVKGLVTPGTDEGVMSRFNPFRLPKTIQEIGAGTDIAQPAAEEAVHGVTGGGAGPVLQGATTAVDKPIADLAAQKTTAYKQIDDAVGFDFKAEKLKLKDTEYAIKQPGADKVGLQKEIDDSTKRIADANTTLAAKNIDPKVADALNTSWQAAANYRQTLVRATASDGTIDVNKLLTGSKNLRFSKWGDRLAQAFGKGDVKAGKAIADSYIAQLEAAKKAGVAAVRTQTIAKWVGGAVLGGGTAGELLHLATQ